MKSTYEISCSITELDGLEFRRANRKTRLVLDKDTKKTVRLSYLQNGCWDVTSPGKFYLAGPMRGYPLYNFPAFLLATRVLTARGLEIKSPAEKDMEAGFDPSRPLEGQNFDMDAAFRWDFTQVIECQGTILMPGWEKSTGAKAERLVAHLSGREVYLLTEDFRLIEAPPLEYYLSWGTPADLFPAPAGVNLPTP